MTKAVAGVGKKGDSLEHPYRMERTRDRGKPLVVNVTRGGKVILTASPDKRTEDLMLEVARYLNRDRREIVFIEEAIILAEKRSEELHKLCGLLLRNIEWCAENMDDKDRKLVAKWASNGQKSLNSI